MNHHRIALSIAALLLGAWSAPAGPITITRANQSRYTHILPTGRAVSPTGTIVATPNFPTAVIILGNRIAVLANGATRTQSISLYDAKTLAPAGSILAQPKNPGTPKPIAPLPHHALLVDHQNFFQGLAAGPHDMLYGAGGASNDILAISLAGSTPRIVRRYHLTWQAFPHTQYPYVYQGARHPDLHKPAGLKTAKTPTTRHFYPSAVAIAHGYAYATGLLANSLARIDLKTGKTTYLDIGAYPDALAFADHDKILAVSLWGDNAIALVDPSSMTRIATIQLGPHLTATSIAAGLHPIALAARQTHPHLYVALANGDQIVEIDTATHKIIRRFSTLPYPGAASGSYPDGLALRGHRLFVTNAGNDDIMTIDTRTGAMIGLTPTGWYPTELAASPNALYAVAAKGLGSGPNAAHQWVGNMMHGLLQKIPRHPTAADRTTLTNLALHDNQFRPAQRHTLATRNARLTTTLRHHIKTVVFILRENKTFDEEFGRYPGIGHWANPKLDLYDHRELLSVSLKE